jgi:hypothetical protein
MLVQHTIWSWAWWIHMLGWDLGAKYGTIVPYDPWSGSVSDFGLIAAAGAIFTHAVLVWKTHTCHLHWWCWRKPLYQLGDSPHMLCRRHHPDEQQTVKEAVAEYKETAGAQP